MGARLLIHGVPDSSAVWRPLLTALYDGVHTESPDLPGFHAPLPPGFRPDKDSYAAWVVAQLERLCDEYGPVDIVGHDWGALLALRAASLRPEPVRSWAISNAMIDANYNGHRIARAWATPVLGELVMAVTRKDALTKSLVANGLPASIAQEEVAGWNPTMRRCILGLYRSAVGLKFSGDWVTRLEDLPSKGLVIWGENDPYVPLKFGIAFAARHNATFYLEDNAGHWAIAERPENVAKALGIHWQAEGKP
ncbi:MAG: alpha/beta hydrolase [Pseudomonadota bacterium]